MHLEVDEAGSVALATVGQRIRTTLLDLALCALTSSILVKTLLAGSLSGMSTLTRQVVSSLVFTVLLALYEVLMLGLRGRTLGNEVTKTAVVHADDLSPVSMLQAVIRFFAGPFIFCVGSIVFWLIPYVIIDHAFAARGATLQTLHDRAARTVVVVVDTSTTT
ncbi:MAG: RDD family protein [Actinomycetota bacterium]